MITDQDLSASLQGHLEESILNITSNLDSFKEWADHWKKFFESENAKIGAELKYYSINEVGAFKTDISGKIPDPYLREFSIHSAIIINYDDDYNETVLFLDGVRNMVRIKSYGNRDIYDARFRDCVDNVSDPILSDCKERITYLSIEHRKKNPDFNSLFWDVFGT